MSGYWPERFPNTLVTEHKHSHQEEIVPFSLLGGWRSCKNERLQIWLSQEHLSVVKALRMEKYSQVSVDKMGTQSNYYAGSAF